jgi:hypothetical protein
MTSLRRSDANLHHPDGSHRSTPPTANGRQIGLHHARLVRHLAQHEAAEKYPCDMCGVAVTDEEYEREHAYEHKAPLPDN